MSGGLVVVTLLSDGRRARSDQPARQSSMGGRDGDRRRQGLEAGERGRARSEPPQANPTGARSTGAVRAGGEGGIRTPDTVARMPHFECGAFNHSATSPGCEGV